MAYKIKLDNKDTFDLKDGFTIKEELNETLDSGVVQFNTFNGELENVSFDKAVISDTENKITNKYFDIDSYDDEIYSFGANFESDNHFYTMQLFSETKELERITLPNHTVTQPILEGIDKKSVYDEIVRFCSLYIPKIRVVEELEQPNQDDEMYEIHYQAKFQLDARIQQKFSSIECPEFQWNEPTLREVLNDLMSTADCIVIVKQNVISFIDLRKKGSQIDTSKLSYSKKTMSSNDYVGELTVNMKNAIGKDRTVCCEKKSLRTTEGELTTTNALFITQQPIYNIISCKVSFFTDFQAGNSHDSRYVKDLDITDYIVEKDIYEIARANRFTRADLEGGSSATEITTADKEKAKGYKQFLLYYKRGENTINGWGNSQSELIASTKFATIEWIYRILKSTSADNFVDADKRICINTTKRPDIRGVQVDLVYETLSDKSLHIGRYLPFKHNDNRIFDNQTSSYVDTKHLSIFEYAKIKRLGNKVREIYGEYSTESDIPELGDYIGDEILFSKEVTYYDNILMFKGYLIPNYVLRDYYTGVQAKRRSWQLAKENDALSRNHVIKYYVEFSDSIKKEADEPLLVNCQFLVDAITTYASNNASRFGAITSFTDSGLIPAFVFGEGQKGYQIDLHKEVQGMSIALNMKTLDNVVIDYYVEEQDDSYINNLYAYCDNNGELISIDYYFFKNIDSTDGEFTLPADNEQVNNATMNDVFDKVITKPLINLTYQRNQNYQLLHLRSVVYKDNREIIGSTLQFEYCSDDRDIIVTNNFIKKCSFFNNGGNPSNSIYLYYYPNKISVEDEKINLAVAFNRIQVKFNVLTVSHSYHLVASSSTVANYNPFTVPSEYEAWAITDVYGNILIAKNRKSGEDLKTEVNANILSTRDDNVYYSVQDRYICGTIADSLSDIIENYEAHSQSTSELPSIIHRGRTINRNTTINVTIENNKQIIDE